MSLGDVDASSFEFYEGIRIFVPGAFVVGIYSALVATFGLDAPRPSGDALGAVVAALAAGLMLYLIDAPGKSAYYVDDQPHHVLTDWDVGRAGVGPLNLYFIILDETIPPGVRTRALYMGSMYRIGWETIYLLAVSSLVVIGASQLGLGPPRRISDESIRWIFGSASVIHMAILPIAAKWDNDKIHSRTKQPGDPESVSQVLRQQFGWWGLAATAPGAALGILYSAFPHGPKILLTLAIAGLGGVWAVRYFQGYKRKGELRRRPLLRLPALLPFSIAGFVACGCFAIHPGSVHALSAGAAVGWSALSVLAAVLILARGHEKRLGGTYATQRNWLITNRESLEKRYGPRSSSGT